jgi:DNA-nicking Smr family endonuclease
MTNNENDLWKRMTAGVRTLKAKERVALKDKHKASCPPPHKQVQVKQSNKNRKRIIPYQETLDLHGYTLEQGYNTLENFIKGAWSRDLKCVLIITGKGSRHHPPGDTLQHQVPRWLEGGALKKYVHKTEVAHIQDGGAGALYVYIYPA